MAEYSVVPQPKNLGALAGSTEAEQYQEALAQSMKVLAERANPPTNLNRIAAGFLKPTRGGSFGESLGNVNEEMAKEQEQRDKEALPIAQMRAALAGQKYEVGRKAKAMEMASSLLGVSPSAAQEAISGGNVPLSTLLSMDPSKISALMLVDKDTGLALKEGYDLALKAKQSAIDDAKAGVSVAELEAKYPGITAVIPKSVLNPAAGTQGTTSKPPTGNLNRTGTTSTTNTANSTNPTDPNWVPMGEPTQGELTPDELANKPTVPAPETVNRPATGGTPNVVSPLLGRAAQQDVLKKMSEEDAAGWNKKAEEIRSINPATQVTTFKEMQQVVKYLSDPRNTKVVGILQQNDKDTGQGYWNSFLTGLNDGIQSGKFGGGGISLPVEKMAQVAGLDQRERTVLTEINRITKKALLNSIAESGKALGVNPTDADAQLYAATQASVSNLAPNIIYWAQHRAAQADFKDKLYKSYKTYAPGKHPAEFFADPNSGYDAVHNQFYNRMDALNAKAPGLGE